MSNQSSTPSFSHQGQPEEKPTTKARKYHRLTCSNCRKRKVCPDFVDLLTSVLILCIEL